MIDTQQKPRLGVSACLMGKPVRFDGGHKGNRFILERCAQHFELHPVCPEAELGLGTPRPAMQLRRFGAEVRLVYSKDPRTDAGPPMREFAHARIAALMPLDGFIFKKDSPTCGMERVPVFDDHTGQRLRNGAGVFAATFNQLNPGVPTEEEGRLGDTGIRENFLERVYAHYRWRQIDHAESPLHAFREYHKNYKLVLMAKSGVACRTLGQLVAHANCHNLSVVRQEYYCNFMQTMKRIPSPGQHVNILMHILGYLKHRLSPGDKAELLDWFESYRRQQVSRTTPLALLQHHFRHHPDEYVAGQYYFAPFPAEWMQPV